MIDIGKYTGAVNVNGDVTPVTRVKVETVSPEKWMDMGIGELFDQRVILADRMIKAHQAGHAEIGRQILGGISQIDAILRHKDALAQAANQEDVII